MAERNELGQTLEGARRQAQRVVRELTGAALCLTSDDVVDHWRCALDGEQAAEDWLRREGFEKEADAEWSPPSGWVAQMGDGADGGAEVHIGETRAVRQE